MRYYRFNRDRSFGAKFYKYSGIFSHPTITGMSRPSDNLPVVIEEWTTDGTRIVQVLARCANVSVARGAYPACRGLRPKGRIMIRQGALVSQLRSGVIGYCHSGLAIRRTSRRLYNYASDSTDTMIE
jgi:hypothetical protein